MSASASSNWREKYLHALSQQELFQRELTLFKKALSRVSLAAQSHDPDLDDCVSKVNDASKQGGSALQVALDELDRSLRAQSPVKESRSAKPRKTPAAVTLLNMAEEMLQYTKDRELKQQLKGYIKALKADPAGDMTPMLKTLAYLQGELLKQQGQEGAGGKPGLLRRLFGCGEVEETPAESGRDRVEPGKVTEAQNNGHTQSESAPEGTVSVQPEVSNEITDDSESASEAFTELYTQSESESQTASEGSVGDAHPLEGQLQTRAEAQAADEKEATLQRPVHEPAFSRVSDKVERVLIDLLDKVEPVACTEQKALNARERLQKGLNWYELVPTLEDIRDLVLQAYLLADEEYRVYLQQLHEILGTILEALGVSLQTQQAWQESEQVFEQALQEQLGSLSRSVSVSTEVQTLKETIHQHLAAIQDALEQKQRQTAQNNLSEQLQKLVEQVQQAEREAASNREELERQKQKAVTDALTGLPNREAYNQRAHLEWSRWQRYGHALTMAVIDIDRFKSINDTYGHQTGDRVLQVLAKAVSKRLRSVDFMARFGGEEFVVMLPDTELDNALILMNKIRSAIAETPFRFKDKPVQITFSCGVVQMQEGDTLEAAFARADELLYKAKEAGRNCCMS